MTGMLSAGEAGDQDTFIFQADAAVVSGNEISVTMPAETSFVFCRDRHAVMHRDESGK